MRGFAESKSEGEWDMLIKSRPLDIDHRVAADTVVSLYNEILENPPVLPPEKDTFEETIIDTE
jgi:hypothetical protein